jgi:hypothetical protein
MRVDGTASHVVESHETGDPIVTTNNSISALLRTPLGSDWTVEGLAEQVLDVIAAQPGEAAQEFVLDEQTVTDRQSRRLLRPLVACLATKSAAEVGAPANLYGGGLCFKRAGADGPIWILGQYENQPGNVRVTFRRSSSAPDSSEPRPGQAAALADSASNADPSAPGPLAPR